MEIAAIIELLAVIIGVIGIFAGFKSVNNQMFIQIFSDYTKRYSEIMDLVPHNARSSTKLSDLNSSEQEKFVKAIRKYMNLCSEELFLANTGRLDPETWEMWKTGIEATLNDYPSFGEVWEQLKPEYDYYPEFQQLMSELYKAKKIDAKEES